MYAPSLFPSRERSSSLTGSSNTPFRGGALAGSPYLNTAGGTPGIPDNTGLRNRRSSMSNGSSGRRGGNGRRVEWEAELRTPRTIYSEQRSAPPTASLWDEFQTPLNNNGGAFGTPPYPISQQQSTPMVASRENKNWNNHHQPGIQRDSNRFGTIMNGMQNYGYDAPGNRMSGHNFLSEHRNQYNGMNNIQRFERWILVFGFSSQSEPTRRRYLGGTNIDNELEPPIRVLDEFRSFGDIIDHDIGNSGNWCFLRYASTWQAEKAVQHGALLVEGCGIVGALRVTNDIAHRFGLIVDEMGNSLKRPLDYHHNPNGNNGFFSGAQSWASFFGSHHQPQHRTREDFAHKNIHQPEADSNSLSTTRSTNWCARLIQYLFATDLSQPR
uniref:RRM Nup35-type domain-containing protein n=1 Tax=Aureoumbra lagunensis TaxID=44058 RepID=A0A7S3JX78_9STRA|mmetsp:Transcript_17403/g.22633  ORF Transcript_17403/g.22633 Transcript_17403/m.22633 type:complete len:383 (+) Transcript_17403:48-1196(+)